MQGITDSGYRVVQRTAKEVVPGTAVPGPRSAVTELALSGLPSDRFTFEGFLPRKPGERSRVLAALATEERTMVFFESPRRAGATLAAMAAAFAPDRHAVGCRGRAKTHE